MAESALSKTYAEIGPVVARSGLGYDYTLANLSTQQTADVNDAIDKGYTDFLKQKDWTFLRKFTTIQTSAPYSTGTITITNGDATVVLAGGTWPTWAAQGTIYYNGSEYDVSTRTDGNNVELLQQFQGTTASGASYEIRRVWYTLPDDFGQPRSWFTHSTDQWTKKPLTRIAEGDFRALRTGYDTTSYPRHGCIRANTNDFDGTSGTRWEAGFFPLADDEYDLGYTYFVNAAYKLRSAAPATPYPLGGMSHAQAIQDCCIAAARYLFRDLPIDQYKAALRQACEDSIRQDDLLGPADLGYQQEYSDLRYTLWGQHRDGEDRLVTVNGVTPDY